MERVGRRTRELLPLPSIGITTRLLCRICCLRLSYSAICRCCFSGSKSDCFARMRSARARLLRSISRCFLHKRALLFAGLAMVVADPGRTVRHEEGL